MKILWSVVLLAACPAPMGMPDAGGAKDSGVPDAGRDAGLIGVCSPVTCPNGCCAGSTCIPGLQPFGGACHGSESCDDGGCCGNGQAAMGDSCSRDTDCCAVDTSNMNGGPAFCQTTELQLFPGSTQSSPGAAYPGGYCTRQCYSSDQCGTGNRCGFYGGYWGEARSICLRGCDVDLDCRAGYVCLAVATSSPSGVCIPSNLPDGGLALFDAGPPPAPGTVGKDCTQDSDCQAETKYGRCLSGTLPDGGMSGFGSGECVVDCTMTVDDAWCNGQAEFDAVDGGARCDAIAVNDANGAPLVIWECKKGCTTDADCKPGYHCTADGFGDHVCEPNCDRTNACGSGGCLTSWGCFTATCDTTTHDCH